MKRAGIFFFYDAQGVVDRYIEVLLRDMRQNLDFLLAVVNGTIVEAGRERLEGLCDEVLVRENTGFDVWAYKTGLEHIGWDALAAYDEVVLFNHTSFGPVYPFREMFEAMASRDVDFWGITRFAGHGMDPERPCEDRPIPPHIQSSLLVVRNRLFTDERYHAYWKKMPMIKDYFDSIYRYEGEFTRTFEKLGFRWDVYVNTEDLDDVTSNPLMLLPTELVKNRRCPIVRRRLFFNEYEEFMEASCGAAAIELWDYLRDETDFDLDMVWDSLLRTANMFDLKERLQLNYIQPRGAVTAPPTQKRVALFAHLYYVDLLEELLPRFAALPEEADLYVTTNTEEKAAAFRKGLASLRQRHEVVVIGNRGREYAGFLIGVKDHLLQYDLVGVMHGKKAHYDKPYLNGDQFFYHCMENTLATKEYVQNTLALFDRYPRLGLLTPPTPQHGLYYTTLGQEWHGNFEGAQKLCQRLGVQAPMSDERPPVAPLGGVYWCRLDALRKLFEYPWKPEDFPEEPCTQTDWTIMHHIERCYPFVAQDAGYYTAWTMSDRFAAMLITNQQHTLRDINLCLLEKGLLSDRAGLVPALNKTLSAKAQLRAAAKGTLRKLGLLEHARRLKRG